MLSAQQPTSTTPARPRGSESARTYRRAESDQPRLVSSAKCMLFYRANVVSHTAIVRLADQTLILFGVVRGPCPYR